jgi:hypothetical protein
MTNTEAENGDGGLPILAQDPCLWWWLYDE